jgi:RNA polymerase sigma-70 factor, ECF subfamily
MHHRGSTADWGGRPSHPPQLKLLSEPGAFGESRSDTPGQRLPGKEIPRIHARNWVGTSGAVADFRTMPSPVTAVRDRLDDETANDDLVRRVLDGDERAFSVLYRRHARYVAGVACRLMGDTSELDDIVQDTFVAASLSLRTLQDPSSVRAWLVTIAVRSASKRLKARMRRRWMGQEFTRLAPKITDHEGGQKLEDLYDALDRIPTRLRVPWILVRVEGLQLTEAAEHCDVSLATLKRRVADAEERLDKRLHA